jgi:hypothetical protein
MPSKAWKVRAGIEKSWDADFKACMAVLTADNRVGKYRDIFENIKNIGYF